MQIKTHWDPTTRPPGWQKINKMDTIKRWQRCGAPRTLRDCRWECRMVQLLWRSSWQHLLKVNKHLPYSPGSLPGTKRVVYRCSPKTYARMFTATLFVRAPNSKVPKCSVTIEWINELWHICRWIWSRKKNRRTTSTCNSLAKTHKITLSNRSRTQKDRVCDSSSVTIKNEQK